MGSSSYGPYSSTQGGSQPYAEFYHVVPKVLAADKKHPDIYNIKTGYFKNPTAISIEKSVKNGKIYVDGKRMDGPITYVIDKEGKFIIGKRKNPNNGTSKAPHPTLISGKDPVVQCAGMISFSKGRILSVDNMSGHFRPYKKSMDKVYTYLRKFYKLHPEAFSNRFKWED